MSALLRLKNSTDGYKQLTTDLLETDGSAAFTCAQILSQHASQALWVPFEGQPGKGEKMVKKEFYSVTYSRVETASHCLLCFMPDFSSEMFDFHHHS